jgi:hypothetical protein
VSGTRFSWWAAATSAARAFTRAHPHRPAWVVSAVVVLLIPLTPTTAAAANPHLGDATVISNWNVIARDTLLNDPGKKPTESNLYLGFVNAAVYDAIVGIDGRYEPYRFRERAPRGASDQAAAVAAAHKILVTYSPYAQSSLDTAYSAALAQIPDGQAKTDGIAFGIRAADNLISLRANDGRNAPILFTRSPAPGVWRPTPPAFLSMFVPWMGAVTPLLVRSGAQFGEPGPPPALTSRRYTRDFAEVKALGSVNSTVRTADQTGTALFFSGSATIQLVAALVDQAMVRHLDIVDAARMFAAVNMSVADTIISVWHAKLLYGFWRPITAITLADTDGNRATAADPNWAPLLTTPPYPEFVSGYSGLAGALTRSLTEALRTHHLRLSLISSAVPNVTRGYDSGKALDRDVISARVWLGIHFRTADRLGVRMGHQVADWALDHFFRPLDEVDD